MDPLLAKKSIFIEKNDQNLGGLKMQQKMTFLKISKNLVRTTLNLTNLPITTQKVACSSEPKKMAVWGKG